MLNRSSREFRAFFLLNFTKELIEQFKPEGISVDKPKRVASGDLFIELEQRKRSQQLVRPSIRPRKKILRVPKTKLPPHLQYLKPTPTRGVEIDLGKLNDLAKDPMVKDIECNGSGKNVLVRGSMGEKKTSIILTREEIDEIIQRFSEISKIPTHEGFFKVVVGNFIFSAIISSVTGSKFIIKKMTYSPSFRV